MKRNIIAALMILVCLFAFLFSGCKSEKDILKGKEILIGHWWGPYDVNTVVPANPTEEALLEWRLKIQKDHDVTIKEVTIGGWNEMMEVMTTSFMSRNPPAQVFFIQSDWAISLIRQGLLAALSDSNAIDLKNDVSVVGQKVQYNQDVREAFTFGGKQYALQIGYGARHHGLYFNQRLFREAGLDQELPFNMQRDGTWNWDNFLEISKALTRDRNNTGRVDTWAMATNSTNEILQAFVWANGAEYVGKDAQGRFFNASGSAEFLEALNYIRRLDAEGVLMQAAEGANWDWHIPMFVDGHTAMIIEAEWQVGTWAALRDDWGYVLAPKGPRVRDYIYPTHGTLLAVPSMYSGEDLDAILKAIELWNMPVSDDWKSGLWNSYPNPRSIEETLTLVRTPGYGHYMNNMMIPGLEVGDIAWHMFWWDDDPARLVERASPNWNSLIADVNNSFFN